MPSYFQSIIIHIFLVIFLIPCYADVDVGSDTLLQSQQLKDGEYLKSTNSIFRLQFFSPGNSKSKFLGIFHNSQSENPVWVGNRDAPVPDLFAVLIIDKSDGLLKISYHGGKTTIVSNSTASRSNNNTSATILDNGNLVLNSAGRTIWQSFDYPTDTFLPGMRLGMDFKTGAKWSLTSWVSDEVPASGSFTLGMDPNWSTQLVIWWHGNVFWTSGVGNNFPFDNSYETDLSLRYIWNESEKYLTFSRRGNISLAKVRIDFRGSIEIGLVYDDEREHFSTSSSTPCSLSGVMMQRGCVMEMRPKCSRNADLTFRAKRGSTVGYGYGVDENQHLSIFDCEAKCRQNCSCIAFTSLHQNGTGCEIFNKDIWFIRSESQDSHSDERMVYFIEKGRATQWWIWLINAAGGAFLLVSILCCVICIRRKRKAKQAKKIMLDEFTETDITSGENTGAIDRNHIHLFSFESLEMATNNFSTESKLGEGGFGPVYKGKLASGQEIAIKRLSKSSGQGMQEFKNEILLIAKLQHDNLVKILGCCMKGQEKILVYEYMPNRSLDFFIFDPSRRELIRWGNRMSIIEGVAQGLIYLHKYSRLKVIHRDLKASNILLDQNMNPKISDFGMARIFGKQDAEVNTNRIVGTHGYMSPEYAIKGVFSVKSDVFSFGVLLLEIVSGKKNRGCYHSERPLNLIGLAWELWVEGRAIELIDPTLDEYSNHKGEIVKCINVGLLCVQDNANDRPYMTDVITMLTNESSRLPEPKQPAFFIETSEREDDKEVDVENPSTNSLSISVMEGR